MSCVSCSKPKMLVRREADVVDYFKKTKENFFSVELFSIPEEVRMPYFLKLVDVIQANREQISKEIETFLTQFFGFEEKDILKIGELAQHRYPLLAKLFGKFYTRSMEEFLQVLNGRNESFQLKKEDVNVVSTHELLVQIVCELAKLEHIKLSDFIFSTLQLENISLEGKKNLNKFEAENANLKGAKFNDSEFTNPLFRWSNLSFAFFNDATLTGADFEGAILSNVEFKNAKLTGAKFISPKNMEHANLEGAEITDSTFSDAELYHANLNGARLKNVTLSNVRMEGVKLSKKVIASSVTFKNVNLTKVVMDEIIFKDCFLENVTFCDCNLTLASMEGMTLPAIKFNKVNLNGAKLNKADLTNAQFVGGTTLNKTELEGAILNGANFEKRTNLSFSRMKGAWALKAKFPYADLSNAIMEGCQFIDADLSNAKLLNKDTNLTGANLTRATLVDTDFTGANLTNAILQDLVASNAKFLKADLTGAIFKNSNLETSTFEGAVVVRTSFEGATISLRTVMGLDLSSIILENTIVCEKTYFPKTFSLEFIAQCFSPDGLSLLRTIQSIPDQYGKLKIEMVEILIKRINECSQQEKEFIFRYKDFFRTVLFGSPLYSRSPLIVNFMKANLLPPEVVERNSKVGELSEKEIGLLYRDFIRPHILNNFSPWFYLEYSAFINQFIFSSTRLNNQILAGYGHELRNGYFTHIPQQLIQFCVDNITFDPKALKPLKFKLPDSMLFLSSNANQAILVPIEYFRRNILECSDVAASMEWSFFTLLQKRDNGQFGIVKVTNVENAFENFPIFRSAFKIDFRMSSFLPSLKLGEFFLHFQQAMKVSSYKNNEILSPNKQLQLADILMQHMQKSDSHISGCTLLPEFEQIVNEHFSLNTFATNKTKQGIYFALGAFFARLSSSKFFGAEHNSPEILRKFASAFIHTGMTFQNPPEHFRAQLWYQTLNNDVCSDQIAEHMINELKRHGYFEKEMEQVIPPSWR